MAVLPEGMTVKLTVNKETKTLCYHVHFSQEYIKRSMLNILDERIVSAEIALPLCKHTKRKHRLTKLLIAMREVRERYINELDDNDKDL